MLNTIIAEYALMSKQNDKAFLQIVLPKHAARHHLFKEIVNLPITTC